MHTSVRSNQVQLTPGEQIAESILSLLDEPDSSDKRWRAPIFQRLPERFAENAAYDYKKPTSLKAGAMPIRAYLKPMENPTSTAFRSMLPMMT